MEANKREKVTRVGGRDKEARMVISLLITVWYYSFCRFLLSCSYCLSDCSLLAYSLVNFPQ